MAVSRMIQQAKLKLKNSNLKMKDVRNGKPHFGIWKLIEWTLFNVNNYSRELIIILLFAKKIHIFNISHQKSLFSNIFMVVTI